MATEVTIQWGVRWSDGTVWSAADEDGAKQMACPAPGSDDAEGEVVCRFIRTETSPWDTLAQHFDTSSVRPSE
jgi:hypothetical protein